MKDPIERQDAIDALKDRYVLSKLKTKQPLIYEDTDIIEILEQLPSAQPEIIRCKDCKYSDENWRRVSVRWLPCMDMRTGSNWFCGSAEEKNVEKD